MALKWKELESILSEARPQLEGSLLQKVSQSGEFAHGEAFTFTGFGEENGPWRLFVCLLKENTAAFLLPDDLRLDNAKEAETFVMVLRKQLLGKRVLSVELIPSDRIWLIHFEGGQSLLIELIPKYGNILLLESWNGEDRSGKSLGSFRKVSLEPGAIYRLPPPRLATAPEHSRRFEPKPGNFPFNRAVAHHYWNVLSVSEFQKFKRDWRQAVRSALKKMKSALENVTSDLKQAEEAELFQRRGIALVAKLYELGPKAMPKTKSIELDDLVVPLDLTKNFADNAELLFKKAKKFTRAVAELAERVSELNSRVEELEGLVLRVESAIDEAALVALAPILERYAIPVPQKIPEEKLEQKAKPYIEVVSSDGFTILCGRNQEENRRVTFKECKGNDFWLHAKGIPGAHVVIKSQKEKTIPLTTLLEAAQLVLYHSKVRKGKRAEVDYTQRKHVRAIKGTLAEVTYTGNKTLYVEADPEALKKILR